MFKSFSLILVIILLGACTVGPNYEKPSTVLPTHWKTGLVSHSATYSDPLAWWKEFRDPLLLSLLQEALESNANLRQAAARIAEGRAALGVSKANRFPALNAQAGANRTRNSKNSFPTTGTKPYNNFGLAGILSYELDLWGRLARSNEAAQAQLLAIQANRNAVRLAVTCEVAMVYFNLLALDKQLAIADYTIKSRTAAYQFQKNQLRSGFITQLTFQQAAAELASVRAQVPQLRQAFNEHLSALSILLGRSPKSLLEDSIILKQSIDTLPIPPPLPLTLPSILLERRPDIQAAEQALIAQNAQIGVAKARYFPQLSLTGLLGLGSSKSNDLLEGSSRTWQIGASLTGPILDFGRTKNTVEVAKSRKEQALITYEHTIQLAFKEVLDALNAQQTTTEQVEAEASRVRSLEEVLFLSNNRYYAEYTNYLELLDAERAFFPAQLDFVKAQLSRLAAAVNLYKALGGGWSSNLENEGIATVIQ
jgi:multidrug efflux system outer membrane protein